MEEVAHYGADSRQIPRRLADLLDELDDVALDRHRTALDRTRALVERRLEED